MLITRASDKGIVLPSTKCLLSCLEKGNKKENCKHILIRKGNCFLQHKVNRQHSDLSLKLQSLANGNTRSKQID